MNTIKIIINKFGPVENQVITLAPLMIFTGKSNIGKSYVNYLVYYFFSAFTEGRIQHLVTRKMTKYSEEKVSFSISINEIRLWLNENAQEFMRDFLGDDKLVCDVNFDFKISNIERLDVVSDSELIPEEISNHLLDNMSLKCVSINKHIILRGIVSDTNENSLVIANAIKKYLTKNLFHNVLDKSVILPPARGAYVGEIYSTKDSIAAATGMFRIFLRDFDLAVSSSLPLEDKIDRQFFESQIQKLVNGKLISEKGNQFLEFTNGYRIPMTAAASSIKELCPLLFYIMNWSHKKLAICLEEPEAHLHPEMQGNIANLLAAVKNRGSFIQLTTHSDYFLQRINQLIKLGEIRKMNADKFKDVCREKKLSNRFYLDKEDVKAYYFETKENGMTRIRDLNIDKNGIPFATFFDTVQRISEDEEYLNVIMEDYEA